MDLNKQRFLSLSNDQVVVIEDNFAFLLQTSYNLVVRMQLQLIEKT